MACASPPNLPEDHAATSNCWDCHGGRYLEARDPDHAGLEFPRDCTSCHGTSSWDASVPDAHGDTGTFPLRGRHGETPCADCHGTGDWTSQDPACFACHRTDYDNTTNPNHAGNDFPVTCADCHDFDTWTGAAAGPHGPSDSFPLVEGHSGVECRTCHKDAPYGDVPGTCDGCHSDDYDASTNPDHNNLVLPTTCADCHSIRSWNGAVLGKYHKFPITSGKHSGADCEDCHTTGMPWSDFTCLSCHEHRKSEVDKKHDEVSGYAYESSACYRCHPRGRED
jgi:hypothetical protein